MYGMYGYIWKGYGLCLHRLGLVGWLDLPGADMVWWPMTNPLFLTLGSAF